MPRADPILLTLLGVSLAGNVYQYRYTKPVPAVPPALQVGSVVPALRGVDLNGKPFLLDFANRPAILYVFSPTCGWCERNLDNALTLSDASRRQGDYDFVAVAVNATGLEDYLSRTPLPWTIVRDVPEDVRKAFRMGGTPATIVVARGGRVQNVWTGAYTPTIQAAVEHVFRLKLPGLRAEIGKS